MTSDDTLVAMLAVAASPHNSLFQRGKWRLETACAAHDDGSRHFSAGPFRILGLRFCRCVKKEQTGGVGRSSFQNWADCCDRGDGRRRTKHGDRSGAFKRAGASRPRRATVSAPPVCLALRNHRDHRFASTLSKFQSKSGAGGAHKKTIRIIYLNPSASRPLPSKTHRDTNLEGFFWRCL